MKRLLTSLALGFGLAVTHVKAQDVPPVPTAPPAVLEALKFLGSGSNWMFASYAIASKDAYGLGVGLGYKISDYVVPTMRLDAMQHNGQFEVWMPSASLQLQYPVTVGRFTLIPIAFGGISTPLAGGGKDNGSPIGIFGVGAAVRTDFLGAKAWWKPRDIIYDYERWTGFAKPQHRFGFVWDL